MKAFIYLSVLLITAGSAFGLADYFKEQKNGTLAKLYREEEEPEPVQATTTTTKPASPVAATTVTRATGAEKPVPEKTSVKTTAVKKQKKKTARKPISFKMFTRGDEFEAERFTPPVITELKEPEEKKAVVEPVKEEVPAVKEPVAPVPVETIEPEKKETKRTSLTKMFSRGRPPKTMKKAPVNE